MTAEREYRGSGTLTYQREYRGDGRYTPPCHVCNERTADRGCDPREETTDSRPPFACGTRKAIQRGPRDHRVVCATCDAGGSTRYETREEAIAAAVRLSGRRCRTCGAE